MSHTDKLDERERVDAVPNHGSRTMEAMADLSIATIAMTPSAEGLRNGFIEKHAWFSEGCYFSQSVTNALVGCRRAQRHADNIGHLIMVHRYIGGSSKGYMQDQILDRKPGPIYILDAEQQWTGIREAGLIQSVYVPKSMLNFDPDQHPSFLEISASSTMGLCLHNKLDELFGHLHRTGDFLYKSAINELIACTKIALGESPQRGDIRTHARAALRRVICDHIEAHLHDPELSTLTILKSYGVSRASLYRMFEADGGVRRYITDRRALRAVVDLSNGTGRRGFVREVGERWGFATPTDFNRTIRRLYDQSPGTLFPAQKVSA